MLTSSLTKRLAYAAILSAALIVPAHADDPVSLATGPQSTVTYNVGLAVAKAASVHGGMDVRLRAYKSTSQAIGFIDSGEVNFGLESSLGVTQAYNGQGAFKDAALTNLRLVATLIPFRTTFGVRKDDPAQTIADIKGRNVAGGFRGAIIGEPLIKAILSTAGLTYDDVQKLEVADLTEQTEQFTAGNLAVYTEVLGSARDEQLNQDLGGVRALPLGPLASIDKIREFLPTAHLVTQEPEDGLIGVSQPTLVISYDYYIYANASVPDDVITQLVTAINEGKPEMEEIVTTFRWFDPARMATDIGIPYHPAAEAYYKAHGLWPTP